VSTSPPPRSVLRRRPVVAWAFYDWANSAFATTVMAGFFPVFFKQYWNAGVVATESTFRLGVTSGLASLLHRRQQQGDQNGDNRNHDQKFDQSKTTFPNNHTAPHKETRTKSWYGQGQGSECRARLSNRSDPFVHTKRKPSR
jgi:hypothetical protein